MSKKGKGRIDAIQGEILHVYDGIEEADNELPTWWLITLYAAIVFAVFYWVAYHELESAALPGEEYAIALAERQGGEVSNDLLDALSADGDAVAAGQDAFGANCAACHMAQAQGNVGPNLTDEFWIYGGSPVEIYNTIHDGADNGMPPWGASLGPPMVQKITAFILSIRDTNVEGKEAEGDAYDPNAVPEEDGDPEEETPQE